MISNYNLSCDYHNFELKDKIYLIPDWALKVIYTDGFNEVVFSGNSANVTILEGYDINFQEETSFDERFKFSKSVSIKVNGYKTFNDLDYRYCVVLETKEGEFFLVNVDFPSFVTHTYSLANGTNSTELVFSSQSNIATLKLTNFEPNNVNTCKQYSNAKIKNVKLTEAWASYLSTWQKSLVNKGEFVDIEPLPDSISLTEEFDGEKYTVTLGFDIPMSYYKNDWHIKLLQFEENKYRGYISLEDGNKAFVGYNVGLFPSYTINGDIISIRLTETAIRGIAYGDDYAVIDTDIPNTIEFNGASCYTYNFESSCDWEVEDKPDYITITPTSGQADTQYELTICNTDDETGYAVSEFIIKTCNARVRPEVVIKNPIYRYIATTDTMCSEVTNERTISSDTYCSGSHNVDKYVDVTKEVSYDSGETWYFASSSSTLVEANSPDCGYRTRTVSTGTTCSGSHNVDKYQLIERQESYDYGNTWVTTSSSRGSLIEANSPDCGYRTQTVSTGYTCDGVDKYQLIENQESYDYGNTWVTVSSTTGSLIAEYSPDCGFDPTPEPLSGQYFTIEALEDASRIVFEMSSTIFTDIDFRYSIDSGTTWVTMPYVHNNNRHFYSCGSEFDSGTKVMFKANFWDDISVFPHASLGSWKVTKTSGGKAKYNVEGNVLSLYFHDFINDGVDFYYPNLWQLFATEYVVNTRKLSLPCTRLTEERCYFEMFYLCEHLVTAPALPATSLSDGCYHQMFKGCIRLTSAPALPATTLPSVQYGYGCYSEMFAKCTSLTVAPVLSANTLGYKSYAGMFSGCTNLNTITCLATDISATNCTTNWVNGVAATGIFYKKTSMSSWTTGNSGIPSGWTVQNYSS